MGWLQPSLTDITDRRTDLQKEKQIKAKYLLKLAQRLIFLFFFWPLKLLEMLEGSIRRQRVKRIFITQQLHGLKAGREPNLQALSFFYHVPHSVIIV